MTAPPTRAWQPRTWLFWFAILGGVGIAMLLARSRLDKAHVALTFLLVVLGGSSAGGRALGVSLAGTAFLAFDWFFLRPYETLFIADPLDWLVLFAFLITGVVAAHLMERQRREAESARTRADEIDRLATLGAETLNAPRAEEALDAIASVIRQAMATDGCAIFLRQDDGGLRLASGSPASETTEAHSALLSYTVDHAEAAAQRSDGTLTLVGDTLARRSPTAGYSELLALGIPLTVRGRVVGALQLSSTRPFTVSDDQRRVLSALSYYAALGVERLRLAGAEEEAESLRRADALKDALLASVSHDLRTPLTAIKAIANEVWRGGDPGRALVIEQEADRLNELVDNLLELSQINAGSLAITVALNTVDEVVGAAVERVEAAHGASDGRIEVHIANDDGILVGEFDFMHTTRALTNLLDNALKYSPPDSSIVLRAWQHRDRLLFAVEDSGRGILPGDEERVFEPFCRGRGLADGVRGTGLGLSIARELAEAQRGTLIYEPRPGGGCRFTLSLPAGTAPAE
jgi:two-component system, OmpR family, sensor histidine kinase KdpD